MTLRLIAAACALVSFGAFAQNATDHTVQRDVNQQNRIERGLQNGTLTAREAALLERDQSRVERLQARDLKDGHLSAAERAQLRAAQDKAGRDISLATHNGVDANPLSASSQRMQADVQRNVEQQKRVEAGLKDGTLNRLETGRLEQGQARVERGEFLVGRDGRVGAKEQAHLQRSQALQSHHIHTERHNTRHDAQS